MTPNNGYYGFGGTVVSPEASFTATSTGSINITVPSVQGAIAYGVCSSTTSGAEVNCFTIPTNYYTDTGTNTAWLNRSVASGNFTPTLLSANGGGSFIVGQDMATENGRDPLSTGLVLDLPANEGSGSIATDRVFGVNYTVTSPWTASGGKFGPFVTAHKNYANGNVLSQYANLQISGLQEFTVSVWGQSNGSTSSALPGDLVYHGRAYGSLLEFVLAVQSTTSMSLTVGTTATAPGTGTTCTSSSLPSGTWTDTNWHLFTATYSQTTGNAVLYEDGVYTGTTCSIPGHINQAQGDFGDLATGLGDAASVNAGANANVTGLRVWNRALSPDEVATLYSRSPTGGNPIFWYDTTANKTMGLISPYSNGTCAGCLGWGGNTSNVSALPLLINNSGNIIKLNGATTTFPSSNAAGVLTNNGSGTLTWGPGGSMVYPGAGVPLSTGSAWGTSYTAPTGSIVGTGQPNTYTAGFQNFSAVPFSPEVGSSNPATCTVGQMFFNTSYPAGQNWAYCTATNTWTQQLNGGGSGVASFTGDGALLTNAASTGPVTATLGTQRRIHFSETTCLDRNSWLSHHSRGRDPNFEPKHYRKCRDRDSACRHAGAMQYRKRPDRHTGKRQCHRLRRHPDRWGFKRYRDSAHR